MKDKLDFQKERQEFMEFVRKLSSAQKTPNERIHLLTYLAHDLMINFMHSFLRPEYYAASLADFVNNCLTELNSQNTPKGRLN